MLALACAALLSAGLARHMPQTAATAAAHRVSIWYRGGSDGQPRSQDLVAIRAAGFACVTWPSGRRGADEVRQTAELVGLAVIVAPDAPTFLTAAAALAPAPEVTIDVRQDGARPAALAWRAVAHGARTVVFDSGRQGSTGLLAADGSRPRWVDDALALSRQFSANAPMFSEMAPGPVPSQRSSDIDVALLQTRRSWILVATNTAAERRSTTVRLPREVPSALWTNLLDGSEMSMLREPEGPRWTVDIGDHGALVYLIEK
jgi:hypothetical protein